MVTPVLDGSSNWMTSSTVSIPFIYYFNGLLVCTPLLQLNSFEMKDSR